MRRSFLPGLFLVLLVSPPEGAGQTPVPSLGMTDQQVKEIVDKERSTRTDLPSPFPKFRWLVRRDGNHYTYAEYSLPETPEDSYFFTVNRNGVIVNVQSGTKTDQIKCPGAELSQDDLKRIIDNARSTRSDLPESFTHYRTRIDRQGCLFLYFEYELPEKRGSYNVFTIDPLGEIMASSRSKAY